MFVERFGEEQLGTCLERLHELIFLTGSGDHGDCGFRIIFFDEIQRGHTVT